MFEISAYVVFGAYELQIHKVCTNIGSILRVWMGGGGGGVEGSGIH